MKLPALALLSAIAAGALACGGPEGTIALSIATAPDSEVMERVERVRLTLSDPPAVVEAERGPEGDFDLALDVVADGERGRITFEGFDEAGELVAVGYAGPLPIAAITTEIAIYVAAPDSFAEAPVRMDPPRAEIGAAPLVYGAILAGGHSAGGFALDEALIYNVHRHGFQVGEPLPAPRSGPAVAALPPTGPVALFGGRGDGGEATPTAWSFDPQAPPAGIYAELDASAELARQGAAAAPLGDASVLVTGDPPIAIDPFAGTVRPLTGAPPLAGTATAARAGEEPVVFITGGDPDAPRAGLWRGDAIEELDAPPALARKGHAAAALPGGDVLVAGGAGADGAPLASAVRYRASDGALEVIDDFLAAPRTGAAIAAAGGRLVVLGGTGADGLPVWDAEIFDSETLEPVGTASMVAERDGASAVPLENGQILVVGGRDRGGEPTGTLELYTPALGN